MPRGKSSAVDVTMETKTMGASRPWNLSRVPMAMRWRPFWLKRDLRRFTWALWVVTTRKSS